MNVRVNGEPREIADGLTVAALLEELGLRAPEVAVEVNTVVVRRARHADSTLSEGDEIEIVTFVGGG
jgi:sulfur carrier protein